MNLGHVGFSSQQRRHPIRQVQHPIPHDTRTAESGDFHFISRNQLARFGASADFQQFAALNRPSAAVSEPITPNKPKGTPEYQAKVTLVKVETDQKSFAYRVKDQRPIDKYHRWYVEDEAKGIAEPRHQRHGCEHSSA